MDGMDEDQHMLVLSLQREKRSLEARVRELTTEFGEIQEQLAVNDEEIQKLRVQVSTLKTEKRQLELAHDDNDSVEREAALKKKISELEADLNEERDKCVQALSAKKTMALALQEAQSKYDQEVGDASVKDRQMRRLQNRLKTVEDERADLERQLTETTAARANADHRIRTAEVALRSCEDNLELVTKRKEKLEKELEESIRDAAEADEHHRGVKSERDRLLEKYHTIEESAVITETKLKQVEEKLVAMASSRDYFDNAARREKERRRKTEADLLEREDECVRMRRNRRNLEEEVDDLKSEVTKYRRENELLQRKLADAKQSPSRSMSRIGSYANLSDSRLTSQAGSSSEWSIHMRESCEFDARFVVNGSGEENDNVNILENI